MKNSLYLSGLLLIYFSTYSAVVSPSERIRVYNSKQQYVGYLEKQADSSIRIYSYKGEFKGKIKDDRLFDKTGHLIEKLKLN